MTFRPQAPDVSTATASLPGGAALKRRKRWSFLDAAGALIVAAAIASVAWSLGSRNAIRPPPALERLTFDSGLALYPSLSFDGRYVAFASDPAGEGNLDIWVQALPGDEPARLTKDAADEGFPSFSPDGARIAFQSERDGGGYIPSRSWEGSRDYWLRRGGSRDTRPMEDGSRLPFSM